MEATYEQIANYVITHGLNDFCKASCYESLESLVEEAMNCDQTVGQFIADEIRHFSGSAAPKVYEYLKENAGFEVGEDLIKWDPENFSVIQDLADRVIASYDQQEVTWELFELGGDDDVDYNGGYLQITVDILKLYRG